MASAHTHTLKSSSNLKAVPRSHCHVDGSSDNIKFWHGRIINSICCINIQWCPHNNIDLVVSSFCWIQFKIRVFRLSTSFAPLSFSVRCPTTPYFAPQWSSIKGEAHIGLLCFTSIESWWSHHSPMQPKRIAKGSFCGIKNWYFKPWNIQLFEQWERFQM